MTDHPLVLGIDLGTSGVKAIAVTLEGHVVAQSTRPLSLSVPQAGWSEQDPNEWWRACALAIRALDENLPGCLQRVEGLALSGQMHGAVFLDEGGQPLRPAILWNDQRSTEECLRITEIVGFERLIECTGNPAYPGFQAPKILWVRDHEPHVFGQVRRILLPKDYINFRLTGVYATEPSDASGTLLYDVRERRWSSEVLAALDLSAALLPPVVESAATVGTVTGSGARQTGLTTGTPVIAGGADNACGALSVGITGGNDIMLSVGTSGTVVAASDIPHSDPQARLHLFCHALPNRWYSMGVILSAGASLAWYREAFAAGIPFEELTASASQVPAGSEGLLFLPYLSGERTPHADPFARGVFVGLSLLHQRSHLTRAVMEGVCFAFRDSVELMREISIHPEQGRLTAGGAQSSEWSQMFADVLNMPITIGLSEMGPAFGAAILAGTGVNRFPSAAQAAERFVELGATIRPNEELRAGYDRQYGFFRLAYSSLKEYFQKQGIST